MGEELQTVPNTDMILSEADLKNASAILSLLNGKGDTSCRLFKRQILVDKSGLESLNNEVVSKLQLHQVGNVVTSIVISFSNRHLLTFKSWFDFSCHNFEMEKDRIQSITLQWDFLIKLDNYQCPQRHTLSVRIASAPKPSDVFKVLLSGGFDEEHDMDIQGSTMIARVDFINNTLAEELLNVVAKWNELCDSAYSDKGAIRKKLFSLRTTLANLTTFFSILSLTSIIAIIASVFNIENYLSFNLASLLFVGLTLIPMSILLKDVGHFFGRKLYEKLSNVMDAHVFNISKGDNKEIKRIEEEGKYKKELLLFFVNAVFSIGLSIVFFIIEK